MTGVQLPITAQLRQSADNSLDNTLLASLLVVGVGVLLALFNLKLGIFYLLCRIHARFLSREKQLLVLLFISQWGRFGS